MNTFLKIAIPLAVIAVGAVGAVLMINARPAPETRPREQRLPIVRTEAIRVEDIELEVASQGTVGPRTESTLVPEVAGRVIEVAPTFASGGFFEKDDMLLRIEPYDYREAVVQARAGVAAAELRLAQEQAEAEIARREWDALGDGEATRLTLREPQLKEAAASVDAARAALERAERNVVKTEIRAPYAGRVRAKHVDVGQYVIPGTPLAVVYAVDFAEVRLPLPDDELAFLELSYGYRGDDGETQGPPVTLEADFAGRTHEWTGRIVRTEGEIDPKTRMVHVVARVADPYAKSGDGTRPPLAAGMFVRARIRGRDVAGVAVIPRSAVRSDGSVLIVDDERRLRFRSIDVLRANDESVFVRGGLAEGELLCVTPLVAVTDGMQVRLAEDV